VTKDIGDVYLDRQSDAVSGAIRGVVMSISKTIGSALALASFGIALAFAPAATADERAAELFELCATCHGDDASGNPVYGAPAIAGMAEWSVKTQLGKFRDGQRGKHFDDIYGMRMRPMALTLRSDEDIAAVSGHVAALPVTKPEAELHGGDAANGKTLYAPCVACHGVEGEGREQLSGSPLANVSDWYLLRQLENFKNGVRGGSPGDQTGAMMRAMSSTLTDEQVMKDIIAYIMTLSK
jgi:cytochrome c553